MIFLITHYHDEGVPEAGIDSVSGYTWTLHRKEKGEIGEAICRSVESWSTERQCRAAINTAKKAMSGVRFAQTRVQEVDGDAPDGPS